MPISADPNKTTGILNNSVPTYSYPIGQALPAQTRLQFVKYDRYHPSDAGMEKATAVITLPLPITVPDNYSFRTNTNDLGIYGNINQGNVGAIGNVLSNGFNPTDLVAKGKSLVIDSIKGGYFPGESLLNAVAALGGGTNVGTAAQAFVGVVQNPHTTIMFDGVNLRTINLEWRLSPKSQEESDALQNIFNTIKLQSHPEEMAMGYALNYPDLVYVQFTGRAEKYFPKFQKAFIQNINITPDAPSGGMALYKSGAPVIYTIQLSLMELSILTRNILDEQINGYRGTPV